MATVNCVLCVLMAYTGETWRSGGSQGSTGADDDQQWTAAADPAGLWFLTIKPSNYLSFFLVLNFQTLKSNCFWQFKVLRLQGINFVNQHSLSLLLRYGVESTQRF